MLFRKHPDPIMGIFIESIEPDIFGRTELEHCFNRAENPEIDEQYTAWLGQQETLDATE